MKFRFKALDRRRQPDQLDSPMLLASSRGWVAVFVVLITTVFVLIWAILGSIPQTTTVSGALAYPGGVVSVQAPVGGTLQVVDAQPEQDVKAGTTVATIKANNGKQVPVTVPADGRVVSLQSQVGQLVSPGAPLLQLEQVGADQQQGLQVQLLVDAQQIPFIREGQTVTVAVPGVSPRSFGRLQGTVAEVGAFPLSGAQLSSISGSQASPASVAGAEQAGGGDLIGPHLVVVQLEQDLQNPSGYVWTSQTGPPITLNSRTPVEGEIELGSISPISMLIGG